MAKKTPIMIQRLKKWKKFKGLKKEDIEMYGTENEKKLLKEYDVFKDEPFEIPLGDPQDPTDDEDFFETSEEGEDDELGEKFALEDEQKAGTSEEVLVPKSLLKDIYEFLVNSEESDQTTDLMVEIGDLLYPHNNSGDLGEMKL